MSSFKRKIIVLSIFLFGMLNGYSQPFGSAVVFDGSAKTISIANNSNFNLTDSITYEAWIKPCNLTGHNMILSKTWCNGAQNAYYFTVLNGKLRWQWSLTSCSSPGNLFESDVAVIQANVWQHVAVVHTSSGVSMYLNGQPLAASLIQGSFSTLKVSNQPIRIGAYINFAGVLSLTFTGLMDEVRLWDANLTAAQIQARYNAPLVGNEPNLLAYYNMNVVGSGNGVTVPNGATSTGSSLNGSTIGSGTWPFFTTGLTLPNLGVDTTICQGDTVFLDATSINATYLWSNSATIPTYTVSQADTVSVDVKVAGCANSDTIIVNMVYNPVVDLGTDTSLCIGQNLVLNVLNSNCTYLWQDNSTNFNFNVSLSGTYWVEVANSCTTITDTIVVNYLSIPIVNLGSDTTLCPGQTLLLDATNLNTTYVWQNNITDSSLLVSLAGQYWVEVSNNCVTTTDTINIQYYINPIVNLGNDTLLCVGQNLILNASNPNSTYLWQDNSTNSNYLVSQSGSYWVEVTNSCTTITDTIVVNYLSNPTVNFGNDTTLCPGQTLLLDATNLNTTYVWQNNTTDSSLLVSLAGQYWVEVSNNCVTTTDTINIQYYINPIVNLGNDTLLCVGQNLILNASNPNSTYLWQDNTTNFNYLVSQPGSYWVEVTNSCTTVKDTIIVVSPSSLVLNLGNDTTLCLGQTLVLDATNISSNYSWQDSSTDSVFVVSNAGKYWVEVSNLCTTLTDTINITYLNLNVDLGNDTVLCQGQSLLLDATTGNANYLWQDNSTTATHLVNNSGLYWVNVSNGVCFDTDSINIGFENLPQVNLGADTTLCPTENLILVANSINSTLLWQDSTVNATFLVTSPGNYWVEATNQCGTIKDEIVIDYVNFSNVNLGFDTVLCENRVLNLEVFTVSATYLWQDNSTSALFTVTQPGEYWVTVNVGRCVKTDSLRVQEQLIPIGLGNDTTLCLGTEFYLNFLEEDFSFRWSDNSTEPSFLVREKGVYFIEVTNLCGVWVDSININFEDCDCKVFIPNAFHPNSDLLNDTFRPKSTCAFLNYEFAIFDRWGYPVFKTINPEDGWDGTVYGVDAEIAIYAYKLSYSFKGESNFITGSVTLVR